MPWTITLAHQIDEVKREITLRERTYPGLVMRDKMRRTEADYHMQCMHAVLTTLQRLAREQEHGRGSTSGAGGR